MTKSQISGTLLISAKYDVDVYHKIIYITKDLNYEPDTASEY
ncbi:MAG: hypothetical protein R2771_13995 [Saprospiraceae bacterium]